MKDHNSDSFSIENTRKLLVSVLLIGVVLFVICGIILTYTLALTLGHVEPFCYISHTGSFFPESSIFTLILSITSLVYCCIIYIRFIQVSYAIDLENLPHKTSHKMSICNILSLVFGLLGSFGLSIAGSFQHRMFHFVHLVGVAFCFYSTYIYFGQQTFFSFRLVSLRTTNFIKFFRLVSMIFISLILSVGSGLSFYNWLSSRVKHVLAMESSEKIIKYEFFKATVVFEWILCFIYQLLLLSLYADMKKVAILKDRIVFFTYGESDL